MPITCIAACRTSGCPKRKPGAPKQDLSSGCPAYIPPPNSANGRPSKYGFANMEIGEVISVLPGPNLSQGESALSAARYAERTRGILLAKTISGNAIRFERVK